MSTKPWASEEACKRIDRIDAVLAKLTKQLDQAKNDVQKLGWPEAAELGHIAEKLEEVWAFWSQSGEEYEK